MPPPSSQGDDYESVMHFGNVTFSKNGEQTMEALDDEFKEKIGQRRALSEGDVRRINRMYECDKINNS